MRPCKGQRREREREMFASRGPFSWARQRWRGKISKTDKGMGLCGGKASGKQKKEPGNVETKRWALRKKARAFFVSPSLASLSRTHVTPAPSTRPNFLLRSPMVRPRLSRFQHHPLQRGFSCSGSCLSLDKPPLSNTYAMKNSDTVLFS